MLRELSYKYIKKEDVINAALIVVTKTTEPFQERMILFYFSSNYLNVIASHNLVCLIQIQDFIERLECHRGISQLCTLFGKMPTHW